MRPSTAAATPAPVAASASASRLGLSRPPTRRLPQARGPPPRSSRSSSPPSSFRRGPGEELHWLGPPTDQRTCPAPLSGEGRRFRVLEWAGGVFHTVYLAGGCSGVGGGSIPPNGASSPAASRPTPRRLLHRRVDLGGDQLKVTHSLTLSVAHSLEFSFTVSLSHFVSSPSLLSPTVGWVGSWLIHSLLLEPEDTHSRTNGQPRPARTTGAASRRCRSPRGQLQRESTHGRADTLTERTPELEDERGETEAAEVGGWRTRSVGWAAEDDGLFCFALLCTALYSLESSHSSQPVGAAKAATASATRQIHQGHDFSFCLVLFYKVTEHVFLSFVLN